MTTFTLDKKAGWSADDFIAKINGIEPTVTSLNLQGLFSETSELVAIFGAIPAHVTSLNLSEKNFLQSANLVEVFASFPSHIIALTLDSSVIEHRSDTNLSAIGKALPHVIELHVIHVRADDTQSVAHKAEVIKCYMGNHAKQIYRELAEFISHDPANIILSYRYDSTIQQITSFINRSKLYDAYTFELQRLYKLGLFSIISLSAGLLALAAMYTAPIVVIELMACYLEISFFYYREELELGFLNELLLATVTLLIEALISVALVSMPPLAIAGTIVGALGGAMAGYGFFKLKPVTPTPDSVQTQLVQSDALSAT